jgi:phosphopantothenoylcysteine synthetase/decarboxylase
MRKNNVYDPNARNPLFAGTDFALDTELYTLARHYHPTVAMFARALIKGEPIHYEGDPLIDHSHMRFLDRYAFKNPKTRHKKLSEVGKAAERQNFDDDDDDHEDDDDKSEEEEEEYEFD